MAANEKHMVSSDQPPTQRRFCFCLLRVKIVCMRKMHALDELLSEEH